jgi:hypothetical protein
MPKRDTLGQTVQEVARLLLISKEAMADFAPIGPRRAQMSNRELKRAVEKDPSLMQRLADSPDAGAQEALEFLLNTPDVSDSDPLEFARRKEQEDA